MTGKNEKPSGADAKDEKSSGAPNALATTDTSTDASQDIAGTANKALSQVTDAIVRAAAATPVAAAVGAIDHTTELNNIDFKKMIAGPLQAVVDAQVASSLAAVDFIQKVGFTNPDPGAPRELVMVDFSHKRTDVDDKGEKVEKETFVKVPLLAMLPIPSLRIEHVIIDFNVKLNSVETANVSDKLDINAEVGGGWGPVNFKVSASYQRQTTTGVEVKKEYALNVNVKAVQDEMPPGLEKILGMLAA